MPVQYGQTIVVDNGRFSGTISVGNYDTLEEATRVAVCLAIADGWYPRRWYQFWRPKCPDHVRAEYEFQIATQELLNARKP